MKKFGGVARDLVAAIGAGLIVYGVDLIWQPAAWIVAGVLVIGACVLSAFGDN